MGGSDRQSPSAPVASLTQETPLKDYKQKITVFKNELRIKWYDYFGIILSLYPIVYYWVYLASSSIAFVEIYIYGFFVYPFIIFCIFIAQFISFIFIRAEFRTKLLSKLENDNILKNNDINYFLFTDFLDKKLNIFQIDKKYLLLLISFLSPILGLYLNNIIHVILPG